MLTFLTYFAEPGFDAPINSLSVQRTLRGSSQARGQLSVVVKNHHSAPMHILYLETMPWHVQFFLHTMKIHVDGLRKGTT
jgi:GPI-anchor transamidase subunit T